MKVLANIPKEAFESAGFEHRQRAIDAHQKGVMQVVWSDSNQLKIWVKKQGWRVPWFKFNKYFISKMLESDENFALVLKESKLEVIIPKEYYNISDRTLHKWDAMYEEREDMGILGMRPTRWGYLVESLREIRRIAEAGVIIQIEGQNIQNVGEFLTWVHSRYHGLEDGYDSWVGDDNS